MCKHRHYSACKRHARTSRASVWTGKRKRVLGQRGQNGMGREHVRELSPRRRCLRQQNSRACGRREVETLVKCGIEDRRGLSATTSRRRAQSDAGQMRSLMRWRNMDFIELCVVCFSWSGGNWWLLMDRYKTVYNTLVWRYIRGLHKREDL